MGNNDQQFTFNTISPSEPTPPAEPPIQTTKSTPKKRKVIIAVLVTIFVALVAAGVAIMVLGKDDKKVETPAPQPQPQAVIETPVEKPALQPKEVTAKIKEGLAAKYTVLDTAQNNKPKKGEVSVSLEDFAPAYKSEGFDFYVNYDDGSTIGVISANGATTDKEIRENMVAVFTDFGLKKTGDRGNTTDATLLSVYEGEGLICTLTDPNAKTSPSSASCGTISEYKTAAETVKPMVDVWPNANDKTVFSNLKLTDSATSGYKLAAVGTSSIDAIGGSTAKFYKKDGGSWTYFKNSQEVIPCDSYNTVELRAAFKGEDCTKGSEVSKVE